MNITKITIQMTLSLMIFLSISGCTKTVEPEEIMNTNKMALNGYDPVSYFNDSRSAQGGMAYSYSYKDLQWYFSSQKNLQSFKAAPQAYIPQFGGFCSYALVNKELVLSDPTIWHIHNDKLYLFEDEDAKNKWFTQINLFLDQGSKQWELILNPAEEVEAAEKDTVEAL